MNLFIILFVVGFLRTVVVIVLVYFALKIFTRYVLPLILDNKLKDMQQKMQEQQKQQQRGTKPEGDVTIEYDKKRNGGGSQKEGEYIDFEEVD